MTNHAITGGCLCGACRYATEAAPLNIRTCHCHICQKATGAPFYARVQVPLDTLAITGPVGWYHSSPDLRRGFCPRCGTTLFSERASANAIGLAMGSLDEPDRFCPAEHIWVSSKQAWIVLADDLPRHAEFP
ncbi:MAG: GFA family protein [Alphaproteobacteria bacterium]|nr:GFA family protein [Alphaproteobacteria bacterium]